MRIRTIVICAATALGVSACGSAGSRSASLPTPPNPIVLSAFITDAHVSVSPSRIGAGPVLLTVTNQASHAAALVLSPAGRAGTVARTAPINPQGVTQVKVDIGRGVYTVALARAGRSSGARRAQLPTVPATTLRVGRERASGGDQVLSP